MKLLKKYLLILVLICTPVFQSCVEELEIATLAQEEFVDNLVVEGVLTDQVQRQRIILSRSDIRTDLERDTVYNPFLPLGITLKDSVNFERGAEVVLEDNLGNRVNFVEESPGNYWSETPLALVSGNSYTVTITTDVGKLYRSDTMALPGSASIDAVYVERGVNDLGIEGVQVYVDAGTTGTAAGTLRYTYEETYKIIAPEWRENDFKLTNYDPCALPQPTYTLEIVPRELQNRVCYNTALSNSIIQNSPGLSGDGRMSRFPLRFIRKDNFIISHRYSILVRQMVQSQEAFSYYERLNAFADFESVFSQVQTGALRGNVFNPDSREEVVLGYIEAVTVSEQRIFFNYEDFFPGEALPPYPFNCGYHSSPESHVSYCFSGQSMNNCPQSIIERVNLETISYISENDLGIGTCPGPYIYVARLCGDCTLLGSNQIPDFWQE